MTVKLTVELPEKVLPAYITVKTFDGKFLVYKRVFNRRTVICLNTCKRRLIVSVTPINAGYGQRAYFLKLGDGYCKCVNMRFDFDKNGAFVQRFSLLDRNYLFPIPNANLYFNGK